MTPTLYLLHGRDSSPHSTKIQHLSIVAKNQGWKVVAPDLSSTKDPDERVEMFLEAARDNTSRSVIVGSSMGGYVALVAAKVLKPSALLLLAPAVGIPGYRETDLTPITGDTTIVHGWNDELISPESIFDFARIHKSTLYMMNDDHFLHRSLPFLESVLSTILKRCSPVSRQSKILSSI